MKIFLSASIPDPSRHNEYTGDIKVSTIRDAIVAFTTICAEWNIPFYFGGHPAISPLIYRAAAKYKNGTNQIKIYQSSFFRGRTPKEVEYFNNISWTPMILGDIKASVDKMRDIMFNENPDTVMAVFIGGMDGIKQEYSRIIKAIPNIMIVPLSSTGGAAVDIFKMSKCQNPAYSDSYAYLSLFQKLLKKYNGT